MFRYKIKPVRASVVIYAGLFVFVYTECSIYYVICIRSCLSPRRATTKRFGDRCGIDKVLSVRAELVLYSDGERMAG